jgi:hypothetical protein
MRAFRYAVLAAFLAAAGQPQPPSFFELILPDFQKTISSGNVIADIPARPISRLTIQLLGSADQNLNYGDLRVRINGKGAGNIFNRGSNERGKFLAMDPSTLRMRPDQLFDPVENTIEAYGKDPRGRNYYQNWILRSGSENVNRYFTYVSTISPSDETGVPPDLNVDDPQAPVAFAGAARVVKVHLKGSAAAASGLASLTLNGKPLKDPAGAASVSFDQSLTVARGETALSLEAVDKKGNKRSITIPVSGPSTAAPRVRLAGQSWALIIGVSHFSVKSGAPPDLPAAAFDAKQLADDLPKRGFRAENIRLITDEKATLEQIRTGLGDFAARAKPEDFLLVFFATQGFHDPVAPEKVYLAASDTQSAKLGSTALEIAELQLLLNRAVRSKHTLLFFDAEHALGGDWRFSGKPIVNTFLLNLFDGPLGRSVLVSGSAGQESPEDATGAASRSLFASTLTDGLSGKADLDGNHVITAKEICSYVAETVRRSSGGVQAPQYRYAESEAESPVLELH